MKTILLFGAGRSATVLIEYLLQIAGSEDYFIRIVDFNLGLVNEKLGKADRGEALTFDIFDHEKRGQCIKDSDIVISLMPPDLHELIAGDCLRFKKDLLTASYVDTRMAALKNEVSEKGVLFLCEMGLDPGIDHMSAKCMIDDINADEGNIISFISHCGGLVASESDDNPWHYKISWNPSNIVHAGKKGAVYELQNQVMEIPYEQLFAEKRFVSIPGHEPLCWYPNRNSLDYKKKYELDNVPTFLRTTLRHPDFIYGWKNIIDLALTKEEKTFNSDNKFLADFFREHMEKNGFSEWLGQKMHEQFDATKGLLAELVNLAAIEKKAEEKGFKHSDEFLMVDDKGDLKEIDIEDLKIKAATTLAERMHDASLTLKQLFYLGMDDKTTLINKGFCSPAEMMQFILEKKLSLKPGDKDLVILHHEIEYEKDDKKFKKSSTLLTKGEDNFHTAMAKTVGLPIGIAAKMILNGTITLKGLHIPVLKEIYKPVLEELKLHGITFEDRIQSIE